VVTGGAAGIGLGIVQHLAQEGMAVVAVDRDKEAVAKAREIAAHLPSPIEVVEADISTPEGAAAGVDTAVASFGRLDLLCNNAGIQRLVNIEDMTLETWRESFRVNVDGTLLTSQQALVPMKSQGYGSIVNIGSISGLSPYVSGGAYSSSKAAISMLTRVMALEFGPFGIRVNCICPGSIRTNVPSEGDTMPAPTHIPIGRSGTPDDVAHMVSYLGSDGASYVTGAIFVLDGGATTGRARRAPGPPPPFKAP
jgi:NAD(P)-dependent dehydrogenase (short-subunit alcohol dehydrogenase family)